MRLAHTWAPETLRPHYPDEAAARARIAEITSVIDPVMRQPKLGMPFEFDVRDELVYLHLALGEVRAGLGADALAYVRASIVRSRKQRFLSAVRCADLHLFQQHYARATMLFIDLVQSAEKQPRAVRAVTLLRPGRCEYAHARMRRGAA